MPSASSQTGSDHGPAGSVAVMQKLPPRVASCWSTSVQTSQNDAVVVPQRGRVQAARRRDAVEVELARPVDDVPDLLPAHQVALRNTGSPGKYSNVEVTR